MTASDTAMTWARLVSDKRFGLEDYHEKKAGLRSDFQRDYDRLIFSSPFRRLQNKTQVFPLPGNIFVHNRLTHSLEVACVGRSLANEVALRLQRLHADQPGTVIALDAIGDIVAAACLAHDLGNPPFGHSGERAISTFFSEGDGRELKELLTASQWADLIHFDGNAYAFRLLTHQFNGRRKGGFAMTYSTLASFVKYPYPALMALKKNKFGYFTAEEESFNRVADELGLPVLDESGQMKRRARHPLVYIVEAADDICYELMDIEDAHKLGLITTEEATDHFMGFFQGEDILARKKMLARLEDPNEQLAYLRSSVVGVMVNAVAEAFVANEQTILNGQLPGSLINHIGSCEREAYERCERLSWNKIYEASDVVDIELAGTRIITFLMEAFIKAVRNPELNYSRLLLSKFPKQYEVNDPTLYGKIMAVLDHVCGMTDVYALDLYRKLNGMSLKINN